MELDDEGFVVVRIKDLIEYLQIAFNPEARLYLDKDGWAEQEINPRDVQDLIKKRGLFTGWSSEHVTLNN